MPGKLRYVADTMSRAYITGDAGCGAPEDMNMLVHSLVENLPATGINEWITKTIKKNAALYYTYCKKRTL